MRDDYLGMIKAAGFHEVTITSETSFPIDCIANDPTAQAIISNLEVSPEAITEIASSIVSVRVSAVKPKV